MRFIRTRTSKCITGGDPARANDSTFSNMIRRGGFKILRKLNLRQSIDASSSDLHGITSITIPNITRATTDVTADIIDTDNISLSGRNPFPTGDAESSTDEETLTDAISESLWMSRASEAPDPAVIISTRSEDRSSSTIAIRLDGSTDKKDQAAGFVQSPKRSFLLRKAKSTSVITLSRRVSTAFHISTVRHRPEQALKIPLEGLPNENEEPQPQKIRIVAPRRNSHAAWPNGSSPSSSFKNSMSTATAKQSPAPQTSNNSDQAIPPVVKPLMINRLHQKDTENSAEANSVATLPTIHETIPVSSFAEKRAQLSVALVERVASTKVYFETYYDGDQFEAVTPRSMRRRRMEMSLYVTGKNAVEQGSLRQHFYHVESNHLRETRSLKARKAHEAKGINIAGFECVRVLGKGSFGVVKLVREKSPNGPHHGAATGAVYAMKTIRKSDMLRNSQEGHLRAERDFLVSCAENSRWIVPLVASFQDADSLYLVMEFEIGGDFLGYLLRKDILEEHVAQWYIAEMILCVEEAHRLKWIHRDVKPDNFLISASGHLKLSDFGLAFDGHWAHSQTYYNDHRYSLLEKFGIDVEGDAADRMNDQEASNIAKLRKVASEKLQFRQNPRAKSELTRFARRKLAKSVVGTSQYMAPEVVQGDWYDGRCDWWSIGIILFECLYGFTPFCRDDRDTTKAAILRHATEFKIPSGGPNVSYAAQELLCRLMQPKELRLSSRKYRINDFRQDCYGHAVFADKFSRNYQGRHVYSNDAEDIKNHRFFAGVPWNEMHQCRPPFIPHVRSTDSTKYFESEEAIIGNTSAEGSAAEALDDKPRLDDERRQAAMIPGMDGEKQKKPPKEKRRPRDRLLRDPKLAKTVMEVRKKGAFLGYTYRRPRTWSLGDDLRLAGWSDIIRGDVVVAPRS